MSGPPRGEGERRPRAWRWGGGEAGRTEQCPELGSSVRCSVQPCGGQCPVQCPRWAVVQAPGRVVSGRASGGRGPGRARCAPCSPGTGALGARERSAGTPPPQPPPPGTPSLLVGSLCFLSALLLQGRVQVSSQPPLPNPGAWRRARPPITRLKPRRVASCAPGWMTAERGGGSGGGAGRRWPRPGLGGRTRGASGVTGARPPASL